MKLVVGMGSLDAYLALAEAGADEVFCGYVPYELISEYSPINRREVRTVNVQLGSESELRILAEMMRDVRVPVSLTFNALCYTPELLERTGRVIARCMELGYTQMIIADPALMLWLDRHDIHPQIHVSGEIGEINRYVISECLELYASRIIFHRKMTIQDMKSCTDFHPQLEYEAFALNEACHFHGGFCNTLHCDLLNHMCREQYRLNDQEVSPDTPLQDGFGVSGCAMCALWKLREAGVTHLKIVGRGNYPELALRDTLYAKQALGILEKAENEKVFIDEMKDKIFPEGCGKRCYYR